MRGNCTDDGRPARHRRCADVRRARRSPRSRRWPDRPDRSSSTVALDGVVDPIIADYIVSAIDRANRTTAPRPCSSRSTRPAASARRWTRSTRRSSTARSPVIGYVSPIGARAASAGAFILLSCPVAAMAPGTNVGASTPIGVSGGDLAEKVQNDAEASIRKLAETLRPQRGRRRVLRARRRQHHRRGGARRGRDRPHRPDDRGPPRAGRRHDRRRSATGRRVTLHTASADGADDPLGAFMGVPAQLLDPNLAFIFFWLGLRLDRARADRAGHIFSGTLGTLPADHRARLLRRAAGAASSGSRCWSCRWSRSCVELHAPGLGDLGRDRRIALLLAGGSSMTAAPACTSRRGVLVASRSSLASSSASSSRKALATPACAARRDARAIVGAEGVALVGRRRPRRRAGARRGRAVAGGRRRAVRSPAARGFA